MINSNKSLRYLVRLIKERNPNLIAINETAIARIESIKIRADSDAISIATAIDGISITELRMYHRYPFHTMSPQV